MFLAIALCLFAACVTPLLYRFLGHRSAWLLSTLPLALFFVFTEQLMRLLPIAGSGLSIQENFESLSVPGAPWSFYADGLSWIFVLLITLIGFAIFIYAGGYMKGDKQAARFLSALMLFMGAMLGIVLSDNFINFFIFWELTSISSYILIGHKFEKTQAQKSALQALVVTGGGGLALLAGLLMLHHLTGVWNFSQLPAYSAQIISHELFPACFTLILIGACTKSAQFPFHFWLPNAMAAPTPASAYLHSATMVKAGIYLIARLYPSFSMSPLWQPSLTVIASATLIVSALLAFFQSDLKKLLAYTTIGALALLLLSWSSPHSNQLVYGGLIFLVAHALYKAPFFMIAGIVDHECGSRDIRHLRGLRFVLPWTFVALIPAFIAKAGFPPSLGFVGKEEILAALPESSFLQATLYIAVLLTAVSFAFVAFQIGRSFLGDKREILKKKGGLHEAPAAMYLPPLVLALLGLILPFLPVFVETLIHPAAHSFDQMRPDFHLAFWHGWNLPFALSLGSWILAGLLFWILKGKAERLAGIREKLIWGTERFYDFFIVLVTQKSKVFFSFVQSGVLRHYLKIILSTLIVLAIYLISHNLEEFKNSLVLQNTPVPPYVYLLVAAILVGSVLALLAKRVFSAVIALGIVGFGIAVIYILHGAPDLAMTQFLVETLVLILLVLVLKDLPPSAKYIPRVSKGLSLIIASATGLFMGLLTYVAAGKSDLETVSQYYAENSYLLAKGKNVVNVILVDFRGLDTLGEITVLALAAVGVYVLLKVRPKKESA